MDIIFNAYFQAVGYDYFLLFFGANVILQFLYEVISQYDII